MPFCFCHCWFIRCQHQQLQHYNSGCGRISDTAQGLYLAFETLDELGSVASLMSMMSGLYLHASEASQAECGHHHMNMHFGVDVVGLNNCRRALQT